MTDNEIIKALECCCKDEFRYCHECPLEEKGYSQCLGLVRSNALDLINRQKAEIRRLRTRYLFKELHQTTVARKDKIKSIKEFAEQIKMAFYCEFDELIPSIMADKIDNLVKEMTEKGE